MHLILALETHCQLSLKYNTIFISHASCQSVVMKFKVELNSPQTKYPYYFGDPLTFSIVPPPGQHNHGLALWFMAKCYASQPYLCFLFSAN